MKDNNNDGFLSYSQKITIGMDFLFSGKDHSWIMEKYGISRSYAYELRSLAESHLASLDNVIPGTPCACLDKNMVEKAVLSLALDCKSTYEGIILFFDRIFGMHISMGKISGIITSYSVIADDINRSVDLGNAKFTANDEIFQGDMPILTSVDLQSIYIIGMEPSNDRTAASWEAVMRGYAAQGFDPEVSISDAGSGLLCGIPRVFPGMEQRPDIFHVEKELGVEVSKLVRKAEAEITEEEKMMHAVSGKRPHKKTEDRLLALWPHIDNDLAVTETIMVLYGWLKELLSFTGYTADEVLETAHWVCGEMLALQPDNKPFRKQVHVFEERLDRALSFLNYLTVRMGSAEEENGYENGSLQCLYRLRSFKYGSDYRASWETVCNCAFDTPRERADAENVLENIINETYRASSMVENLNGRIRDYIDAKRRLPPMFTSLLQLYFNTKPYRRSGKEERIGKTPMEMLTGKPHASFFELLGL